jgi:hypothetical protein
MHIWCKVVKSLIAKGGWPMQPPTPLATPMFGHVSWAIFLANFMFQTRFKWNDDNGIRRKKELFHAMVVRPVNKIACPKNLEKP